MPAIQFSHFFFTPEERKEPVLKDIDFSIEDGEFVVVMGSSGSGKSLLCLCINGIIPHYVTGTLKGSVNVSSLDTQKHTIADLAKKVGMVFQDPETQLFEMRASDDLAMVLENLSIPPAEIRDKVRETAATLEISDLLDRNPMHLSGGQKQRVAIGCGLIAGPQILVLDEPTSDLDPLGTQMVYSTLKMLNRERGMTIMMVDHKSSLISDIATRIVILDEGRVVRDGTPAEVFQDVDLMFRIGAFIPQVTEAAWDLRKRGYGMEKLPIDLEDGANAFARYLPSRQSAVERYHAPNLSGDQTSDPIIAVKGVEYSYPGKIQALKGVDLTVSQGEFVAIIGQNGSGKSTLLKNLNALLRPQMGTVLVAGHDVAKAKISDMAGIVSFLFQNPANSIFCETVGEEIAYGMKNLGKPEDQIKKEVPLILEEFGLGGLEGVVPENLSRGEKQLVAVAASFAMNPTIVLFDEPTSGMDHNTIGLIMAKLKQLAETGVTIVIVTHDMEVTARYADRVVVMNDGKILRDEKTTELFTKDIELLRSLRLIPPQITLLSQMLASKGKGIPPDILTVEEFCNSFAREVKH